MSRFSPSISFGTRMGILAVKAAAHQKQAVGVDLNNPLHQGLLGAAIGGGGTALYDLMAGTKKNRLLRMLTGAGLGGAGGVGLGAIKRLADDYASVRVKEERDKARDAGKGHKSEKQLANEQDVKDHGIYQTQREADNPNKEPDHPLGALMNKPTLPNFFGRGRKNIDLEVLNPPVNSPKRTPTLEDVAGPGALDSAVSVLRGANDVKNVIHNGAVVPLKDLFLRKLQEAESNRIATNRDALMSNSTGNALGDALKIPAINNQPKDGPSTAIPDILLNRPEPFRSYDSKNQLDMANYRKALSGYNDMLKQSPSLSTPKAPRVGNSTSQDDIEKMREAIKRGKP